MLKTYLYLPEELNNNLTKLALAQNKSKAQALREAIKEGLSVLEKKQHKGAEVLLGLAKMAKKYNVKGPRDASINLDYYLWGLPKRDTNIKP